MSDLDRIESAYGSVAEYNRSMREAESEPRLTPAEQHWERAQDKLYDEMKEKLSARLSVPVSDKAKSIMENYWKESYHTDNDTASELKNNAMSQIAEQYGVSFNDTPPMPEQGQFYASYTYTDGCRMRTKYSDAMDRDTFFGVYSDMYAAIGGVTTTYRDTTGRSEKGLNGTPMDLHSTYGSSLAHLRRSQFRKWGVSDPEGAAIMKQTRAEFDTSFAAARAEFERMNADHTNDEEQADDNYDYDW